MALRMWFNRVSSLTTNNGIIPRLRGGATHKNMVVFQSGISAIGHERPIASAELASTVFIVLTETDACFLREANQCKT